jgi:hypothetical protein
MSWEPPRYMVHAAAQALLERAAELQPDHGITTDQAKELAIAAIIAGRQAQLNAPIGRRHG